MRQTFASITHLFRLPALCALCQQDHQGPHAVCSACLPYFRRLGPACSHCANPLPDTFIPICGLCIKTLPAMDRIFTDYRFEEPLRGLLHEFKYREGLYLSSFLASLIAHSVSKEALNTQCLIPIPLHTKRLQQRGFNQAALLTKHLSNTFGIPYQLSLCKKIQHTPPQAGLTAEHRRLNLKKAFHVPPMPYQHITLVDDLLTTGSTAHALASLLKQQGVIRVDVWCCAKA